MKQNAQEVKQRIFDLAKKKGLNQAKLAESIGVSAAGVNKWFKRESVPTTENLEKLAAVLDTTASFLLFGGDESIDRSIKLEDGYVLIPHLDIAASCGTGVEGMTTKSLVKFIKVSTDWLRHHAPFANQSSLNIIIAAGDSMSPTIKDGDMVLVDTSVDAIRSDAIYVFVKGTELFIKRIQRLGDGVRIISDNSLYPPFEVVGDEMERLRIVGRACCLGKFAQI